jgi:hypothetical protein
MAEVNLADIPALFGKSETTNISLSKYRATAGEHAPSASLQTGSFNLGGLEGYTSASMVFRYDPAKMYCTLDDLNTSTVPADYSSANVKAVVKSDANSTKGHDNGFTSGSFFMQVDRNHIIEFTSRLSNGQSLQVSAANNSSTFFTVCGWWNQDLTTCFSEYNEGTVTGSADVFQGSFASTSQRQKRIQQACFLASDFLPYNRDFDANVGYSGYQININSTNVIGGFANNTQGNSPHANGSVATARYNGGGSGASHRRNSVFFRNASSGVENTDVNKLGDADAWYFMAFKIAKSSTQSGDRAYIASASAGSSEASTTERTHFSISGTGTGNFPTRKSSGAYVSSNRPTIGGQLNFNYGHACPEFTTGLRWVYDTGLTKSQIDTIYNNTKQYYQDLTA